MLTLCSMFFISSLFLFYTSFNVFHYVGAEKKVKHVLADRAIQKEGLGEGLYWLKIKEKKSARTIEIFEQRQSIIHFHD